MMAYARSRIEHQISVNATRRLIWLILLVTAPVPYWMFERGWVPTIWLLELAAFTGAFFASEGGLVAGIAFGSFAVQALLYAAVLYGVAALITMLVAAVGRGRLRLPAVTIAAIALLSLGLFRIYSSPLVAGGARTNLTGLFG